MGDRDFGQLLRQLRASRRMSQLDLAGAASVSSRHVSFLENGRSRPSRSMVLTLADALDVPLRDRNALLRAAGMTPEYGEATIHDPSMASVRRALTFLIERHEPYAAVVLDRGYNLLLANRAALRLVTRFSRDPAPRLDLVWLLLDPGGLGEHLVNRDEVVSAIAGRVEHEALSGSATARELLVRMRAYGSLPIAPPGGPADPGMPFLPVVLERDGVRASLFTTILSVGTPVDVTAQELRLETYFPADEATEALLRCWAEEDP